MGLTRDFGLTDNVHVSNARVSVTLVTLFCLVTLSWTFNVDTKFPLIYEAKSTRNEKYFGYAVALHKNKDGF